jgi:hypothetical protein
MDNLLTNFKSERTWVFNKVISQLNDSSLYIKDEAFNKNGDPLAACCSLRTTDPNKDRTEFWDMITSFENKVIINF